jgi:hypothetical protein
MRPAVRACATWTDRSVVRAKIKLVTTLCYLNTVSVCTCTTTKLQRLEVDFSKRISYNFLSYTSQIV